MAVTAIHLTTGSSTTNGPSYTTATITPTPGRLVLVAVLATVSSGSMDVTLSGCGLNWVKVDQTPAAARTLFLFRAMGPTTAPGPVTITGSVALTSALWQAVEFNGADTSGSDGSGAIVQSVSDRPGSAPAISVPLPMSVTAGNSTYAAVGVAVQETPAPGGGGWASLGSTTQSAPTSGLLGEFSSAALQDVTASWSTSASSFVAGVEVKAATAGAVPTGAASGTVSTVGAAVGLRQPLGAASGTVSVVGAAQGGNAPVGVASGTVAVTGSATGIRGAAGTATGTVTVVGTAVGTRLASGSGSGAVTVTGSAVGGPPIIVGVGHSYGFATLVGNGVSDATPSPVSVIFTLPPAHPGPEVYPRASLYPGGDGGEVHAIYGSADAALAGNGVNTAQLTPQPTALATLQTT